MKEAPGSSETSVLIRATRRNIPEDTILQRNTVFVLLGCGYVTSLQYVRPEWNLDVSFSRIPRSFPLVLDQRLCQMDPRINRFPLSIVFFSGTPPPPAKRVNLGGTNAAEG
jgi:hypothetical protein